MGKRLLEGMRLLVAYFVVPIFPSLLFIFDLSFFMEGLRMYFFFLSPCGLWMQASFFFDFFGFGFYQYWQLHAMIFVLMTPFFLSIYIFICFFFFYRHLISSQLLLSVHSLSGRVFGGLCKSDWE